MATRHGDTLLFSQPPVISAWAAVGMDAVTARAEHIRAAVAISLVRTGWSP